MHSGITKAGRAPKPRGKPEAFLRSDHSSGLHWQCRAHNVGSSLSQEKLENESIFKVHPLSLRSPRTWGLKFPGPSHIIVEWGSEGGSRPGFRSSEGPYSLRWRAKHPFSGQDCFPKINTSALCVPSWSPWTWEGSNVPKLLMGSSWWTFRPLIKSGITVINSCLLLSLSHSVSLHIFPVCVMVIVVVVVHVWKENFH